MTRRRPRRDPTHFPCQHPGPVPALAYGVSVLGSFIGLMFAAWARSAEGAPRWGRTALGAVSLGGAAVWSMHVIAMMGFRVSGMVIRYDAWLTVAGAAVSVAIMAAAPAIVTVWRGVPALLVGGATAVGAGVVAVHDTGMMGVRVSGGPGMSSTPEGMTALDFLTPMILGPGLFLALSALLLPALPEEERAGTGPRVRSSAAFAGRDTGVRS